MLSDQNCSDQTSDLCSCPDKLCYDTCKANKTGNKGCCHGRLDGGKNCSVIYNQTDCENAYTSLVYLGDMDGGVEELQQGECGLCEWSPDLIFGGGHCVFPVDVKACGMCDGCAAIKDFDGGNPPYCDNSFKCVDGSCSNSTTTSCQEDSDCYRCTDNSTCNGCDSLGKCTKNSQCNNNLWRCEKCVYDNGNDESIGLNSESACYNCYNNTCYINAVNSNVACDVDNDCDPSTNPCFSKSYSYSWCQDNCKGEYDNDCSDCKQFYCKDYCFDQNYCNEQCISDGKYYGPCDDDGYCHSKRDQTCASECNTNPYYLGDDDILQCDQCNEYLSEYGTCNDDVTVSYKDCGVCKSLGGCGQCGSEYNYDYDGCVSNNPCNPPYCRAKDTSTLCSDETCGYHLSESDCDGCCYRNNPSTGQCDDEDRANQTSCVNYGCYATDAGLANGCNDARCAAASSCGGCCTGSAGQCGDDPWNKDKTTCEKYDDGKTCTWQESSCTSDCGWVSNDVNDPDEGCEWYSPTDCEWQAGTYSPNYTADYDTAYDLC